MGAVTPAGDLVARLRTGVAQGLTRAAARVQEVAVPLTPSEYGDLRGSLTVTPATPVDLMSSVSSDLPYAAVQHEHLEYRHADGQAKFLEVAAVNSVGDVEQILAQAARTALGGAR